MSKKKLEAEISALGSERDYWKFIAIKLLEKAGYEVPETDGPLLRDDNGKLISFESIKDDFLKIKKDLENGSEL